MGSHEKVIVVGQDLFFLPRVQNAAGPHGYEVVQASTSERFHDLYEEGGTALILVDLAGDAPAWRAVVERLSGEAGRPRIVAFGHHADVEGLEEAVALGCDAALSKAQFSRDIVKIVAELGQPVGG